MDLFKAIYWMAFLILPLSLQAQTIRGKVIDTEDGTGLSYASLYLVRQQDGARADLDGKFELDSTLIIPGDTLRVTYLGYTKKWITTDSILAHASDSLIIRLSKGQVKNEINISAGLGFDKSLIYKINGKRKFNDLVGFYKFTYRLHTKTEFDLYDISEEKMKKSIFFKPIDYTLENIDTFQNKKYWPFYFYESISNVYCTPKDRQHKEFIMGVNAKGIKNNRIAEILGGFYSNIDLYSNSIRVIDQYFISPVAEHAYRYYHYYPGDTMIINGDRVIVINFEPRRHGEPLFTGNFLLVDSQYAIKEINMKMSEGVNINFVTSYDISMQFDKKNKYNVWEKKSEKISAKVQQPIKNIKTSLLIHRHTFMSEFDFDSTSVDSLFALNLQGYTFTMDSVLYRDSSYWADERIDSLDPKESDLYATLTRIENDKNLNKYKSLLQLLTTGYKKIGKFEIGNLYDFYTTNSVEKQRISLTIGNTPKLWLNTYTNIKLSYGFGDNKWKVKWELLHLLNRSPRNYMYFYYKNDYITNISPYGITTSTPGFSFLIRKPNVQWKFLKMEEAKIQYSMYVHPNVEIRPEVWYNRTSVITGLPSIGIFDQFNSNGVVPNFETSINFRYAYKEEFVEGNYLKLSLGSMYPVAELKVSQAFKGLLGSEFNYTKINFNIRGNQGLGGWGRLNFNMFYGQIFTNETKIPYHLLNIIPGNDFRYYKSGSLNIMYQYEYLADKYYGLFFEHNFKRNILQYIKWFENLKWRQLYTVKILQSNLRQDFQDFNFNKGFPFRSLNNKWYGEVGTGVDNIFKVLRIDFIWLLNKPIPSTVFPTNNFTIFGSLSLSF